MPTSQQNTLTPPARPEAPALRRSLEELGLDVDAVLPDDTANAALTAHRLTMLVDWVRAYATCPDRAELRRRGYVYPPIHPGYDPESDWLRFERWVQGKPLAWRYESEHGPLPPPDELPDEALRDRLREVLDHLAARSVVVELRPGVPARRVYEYLRTELRRRPFEFLAPASFTVVTGCTGYCPGCFQRSWCEMGHEEEWPEDEETLPGGP